MSHGPEPPAGGGVDGCAPLLVALAVARPQDDPGAVGRARPVDVQAQTGLDAGDRPVGVLPPLLARLSAARPDDRRRTRGRLVVVGVHAPGAVDRPQLSRRRELERLVRLAVAVPDLQRGARRVDVALDVQTASRGRTHQGCGPSRRRHRPGQRGRQHRGEQRPSRRRRQPWVSGVCEPRDFGAKRVMTALSVLEEVGEGDRECRACRRKLSAPLPASGVARDPTGPC